jgi:hypothetical protein
VYQWCGFKFRRGKNKNLTALKCNSNTVWFNFQTYIYIYVSANGHPTDKISGFVDFHLRQHVEALPSVIKDTTDYLQKMAALNPLPPNTTLVTMDVTSIYTNIPHSDDIEACMKFENLVRLKFHLPTSWLQCLRWCLKRTT